MRLFLKASVVAALSLVEVRAFAANETIVIGDSIFALNGVITRELEKASSLDITSYARNGAVMSGIVRQYQQSRANGLAQTVIMNGGGNDVLANMRECRALSDTCVKVIENAISQGINLVKQMENDGVESIFFLGYYYTSSFASGLDEALDYAMSRVPAICESTSVRCVVVDTREVMQGPGNVSWDGIHPTSTGSTKMARVLWESMQANGID